MVAGHRFVVADGDYSVELAMPDKMVEWDVIREVMRDTCGEVAVGQKRPLFSRAAAASHASEGCSGGR